MYPQLRGICGADWETRNSHLSLTENISTEEAKTRHHVRNRTRSQTAVKLLRGLRKVAASLYSILYKLS